MPFRIEPVGWSQGRDRYYLVRSAGADRRFNSGDDLTIYIDARSGNVVSQPGQSGGSVDLKIEHDRGPVNGNAEVTGTVTDATGAIVPGATISLHQISAVHNRRARRTATPRGNSISQAFRPVDTRLKSLRPGSKLPRANFLYNCATAPSSPSRCP